MIPTNRVPITIEGQTYHFTIDEPSEVIYPQNTIVALIDRQEIPDQLIPTFIRTYIAVDEGMTSLEIMGCLHLMQPTYAVMHASIEDAADRAKVLNYLQEKISGKQNS